MTDIEIGIKREGFSIEIEIAVINEDYKVNQK